MGDELDGLKARVMRLEKRSAVLVWSVCVLAFVVLSSLVSRGNERDVAAQGTGRTIEAQQFVLRDANGVKRAALGLMDNDVIFGIYDEFGTVKMTILANSTDCSLMLHGPEHGGSIGLTMRKGKATIGVASTGNGLGLMLTSLPSQNAVVVLDKKGNPRIILGSPVPDTYGLLVTDDSGQNRILLSDSGGKGSALAMKDENDTVRALFGIMPAGPVLSLYGPYGKSLFSAP